jgi:hypothetical protein
MKSRLSRRRCWMRPEVELGPAATGLFLLRLRPRKVRTARRHLDAEIRQTLCRRRRRMTREPQQGAIEVAQPYTSMRRTRRLRCLEEGQTTVRQEAARPP